jgi:CheY-like chemotaxis protein
MSQRKRVLVVEDHAPLRSLICLLLELEGYEVRGAADAADALSALEAAPPPGLILLDFALPGESGYELRERLRRRPALAAVPVVFLTGSRALERALPKDSAVLWKPFSPAELVEIAGRYYAAP